MSPRQKAFRRGDGLATKVYTFRSILNDIKMLKNPLSMAFIDITKAFDSVSQHYILKETKRLGVPSLLLRYIKPSYQNVTTTICGDVRVNFNRGIKQGDPLSPFLFNTVIDWALSEINPNIGVEIVPGYRVNHLAFTHDILLMASSKTGLLEIASVFENVLGKASLCLNATH